MDIYTLFLSIQGTLKFMPQILSTLKSLKHNVLFKTRIIRCQNQIIFLQMECCSFSLILLAPYTHWLEYIPYHPLHLRTVEHLSTAYIVTLKQSMATYYRISPWHGVMQCRLSGIERCLSFFAELFILLRATCLIWLHKCDLVGR